MPVASDFRLYHGNSLDVLAQLLARELSTPAPGASVLTPDTVLIPQPAMRRWLQKTLAEAHGVAANLRFLTPGEFVREALAANPGGDGHDGAPGVSADGVAAAADGAAAADAAPLRWRLWRVLDDAGAMAAPVFAPLRPVLAGPDRAASAWGLAGELAAAFEKYQAWRRGWLLRWDRGADPDDWQAALWRLATNGVVHRARRLHAYLQRFDGDGADAPRGLPPRLFAFACQNVSPDVLRVIASAGRTGPLHFYFVSPVRDWWGDLVDARDRLSVDADGVFAADAENPLLLANGHAGRDFVQLLFSDEAVHTRAEFTAYADPPDASTALLHDLQRDLLHRRPPPAAPPRAFDPADRSLQVHACHTPLREVQVLHDQLRTLLETVPDLEPRDIAVLTPDIDAYAPLVHAVFGGATGARAIPYAVADGSALAAQPLATWWLQLLALPAARFTLPEGIALLSPAPVLQRLGLEPATLDRLADVLSAAGARWGRDAAHRDAHGAGAADEFTWQWAIDRLLLGHALGGDDELDGLVPLAALDGAELGAFDSLLGGLRTLERFARDLGRAKPPAEWLATLADALTALLPEQATAPADRRAVDGLRTAVGVLAQEWRDAKLDGDVPADVVRAWFETHLAAPDLRQPFFAGGVTFGRMVPMRLIPFRVICLLGMDDGAYPRRDPGGALNRLAAELRRRPRTPGDRSVREDDRFLFLQLLAAASDVFYVSFVGRDARSDEPLPPAVVVSELLDVAAKYRSGAGRVTTRHPLHPFAPQAFGAPWPGVDGGAAESDDDARRRQAWQADWRAGAEATDAPRRPAPPFVAAALPDAAEPAVPMTRDELVGALRNPARHFLQQRLGLALPPTDDPLPDSEPFALDDGLHRYALAGRVFALLRADATLDGDTLRRRLVAEGHLPPGPAGIEMLGAARALAGGCARAARQWAPDPPRMLPYELPLADGVLRGRFDAVHERGLAQFRPGREHGGAHLAFGIDHLIWHALGRTEPVRRFIPGEAPRDLPVVAAAAARDALDRLVALARRAAREPLPLRPKAAWAWYAATANGDDAKAQAEAAAAWTDDPGGEGRDPWVRLALRGRDPFFDDDGDALLQFHAEATALFDALRAVAEGDE